MKVIIKKDCTHPPEKRTLLFSGFIYCAECKQQIKMIDPASIENLRTIAQSLGLQETAQKLQGIKNTLCNNTKAPENTVKLYVENSVTLWNELDLTLKTTIPKPIQVMKVESYKQTCGFMPVYDNELKLLEDYPKANYSEIKISQKDYVERIKK